LYLIWSIATIIAAQSKDTTAPIGYYES